MSRKAAEHHFKCQDVPKPTLSYAEHFSMSLTGSQSVVFLGSFPRREVFGAWYLFQNGTKSDFFSIFIKSIVEFARY